MTLDFPSPIAFWLGAWPVHWYGLAYGVGVLLAWAYGRTCLHRSLHAMPAWLWDGFLNWALIGIVVGGRLGHMVLYAPTHYLTHPLDIVKVWQGGMAFHGGLVGVSIAALSYARYHKLSVWHLADLLACTAPIGLALGRIANFVNQEVYGRATESVIGVIFPSVDSVTRHPSQLYEAASEGLWLWSVLAWGVWKGRWLEHRGLATGVFFMGYGAARIGCEMFREPDGIFMGLSWGQWYSLPIMLVGIGLTLWVIHKRSVIQDTLSLP